MRALLIAATLVWAAAAPAAESFQDRIAVCLACHGETGRSENTDVPSLGAQLPGYVLIQLYLFREKQRQVEPMTEMTKDLTDDDLRTFSDFIAKLPAPTPVEGGTDAARMERGRTVLEKNRC